MMAEDGHRPLVSRRPSGLPPPRVLWLTLVAAIWWIDPGRPARAGYLGAQQAGTARHPELFSFTGRMQEPVSF
jgi:hypothetical protein